MDRICENKTRLVEMKGELLVITLVPSRNFQLITVSLVGSSEDRGVGLVN